MGSRTRARTSARSCVLAVLVIALAGGMLPSVSAEDSLIAVGPSAAEQPTPPQPATEASAALASAVTDHYATTPSGPCGPGSRPETTQGRAPSEDYASGRAYEGYTCNTEIKATHGTSGGYRVHRYVDAAGRECAFYDSTLLFPGNVTAGANLTGVYVLDMTDPRNPVKTANLLTPGMQSPHESMSLNTKRGLLAAVMGYPTFQPGYVDIYDVSQDCTNPVLMSTTPIGIIGHEGEFSPDGNTYWATSPFTSTVVALDVSNPTVPTVVAVSRNFAIHGLNISDDGTRFYGANTGSDRQRSGTDGTDGMTILDVSDIQLRRPNPQIRLISHLTWPTVSIPQTAIPVTITIGSPPRPRKFLVEVDEFGSDAAVGAGRIIDIEDEQNPFIVSNLRLAVNNQRADDPGMRAGQNSDPNASSRLAGYDAHYCAVPQRHEPGIVACSFIASGLRVFDIRNPYEPKEIAYFNKPTRSATGSPRGAYAMSAPTFVPERGEIWFSDGNSGFYNIGLTNGVWPFPTAVISAPADGARLLLNEVAHASYRCTPEGVTCEGPVGSGERIDTTSVGTHTFAVTARGKAGTEGRAATSYEVRYVTEAFLAPIRSAPTLNEATPRRKVPAKWRLRDAKGEVVSDRPGSHAAFSWVTIDCMTRAPATGAVPRAVVAEVAYDPAGGHYVAEIRLPEGASETCQRLMLRLDDNTTHTADFRVA